MQQSHPEEVEQAPLYTQKLHIRSHCFFLKIQTTEDKQNKEQEIQKVFFQNQGALQENLLLASSYIPLFRVSLQDGDKTSQQQLDLFVSTRGKMSPGQKR